MKFSKIMVGVEESPDALKAFHYAIQKAKEEQAELVIVSILEETVGEIRETNGKISTRSVSEWHR